MKQQSGERENVFKVYDQVADWFAENRYHALTEKNYLDDLIKKMPADGEILDIGCGTGKPVLAYLVDTGFKVTGVDASTTMLELARKNFPDTTFILEDMRQLHLNKKFNAIVAWHSFFHLPIIDQPAMFGIFARHLKADGILLFTSGTEEGEAWGSIAGEDLFHASLDTARYESILLENDFKVLNHQVNDQSCGGATVWMVQYIPK